MTKAETRHTAEPLRAPTPLPPATRHDSATTGCSVRLQLGLALAIGLAVAAMAAGATGLAFAAAAVPVDRAVAL